MTVTPSTTHLGATVELSSDDLEENSSSCCGHLAIALGIIMMMGSLVAAGWIYPQTGSYFVGAAGLVLGVAFMAWGCCNRSEEALLVPSNIITESLGVAVRAEDIQLPPEATEILNQEKPAYWDIVSEKKLWLFNYQLHRYFIYLALKFPSIAVITEAIELECDTINIGNLNRYVFTIFPEKINNYKQLNVPIYLHVSGNHWTLIYIDRERRTVEYYDSRCMYGNYREIVRELKSIASQLSRDEPDRPPYRFINKTNKLLQPDSHQCGPWVLYFLESRLINPNFNFDQLDTDEAQPLIEQYRRKVQLTLLEMNRKFKEVEKKELDDFRKIYPPTQDRMDDRTAKEKRCLKLKSMDPHERWRQILEGKSIVPDPIFPPLQPTSQQI